MGKSKYIESPEKLWEYFEAYRAHVKANPRKKMVFVGKDGSKDYELLEVPLTIEGFENYCADHDIIQDLSNYFANSDGKYSDYSTICSRIKRAVRQDQIEGGMVGQYNPSITQRITGMADKTESQVQINQIAVKVIPATAPLASHEGEIKQ